MLLIMKHQIKIMAVLSAATLMIALAAAAHYHSITPETYGKWRARKGEKVTCRMVWGHGFEHIWFDIEKPRSFVAIAPDGTKTDLAKALKPIKVSSTAGGEFKAYEFDYTPASRGDHLLALQAGLQWDEEEGAWLSDSAKAVLHVQAESGWDRRAGHELEVVPLSRPYGLVPGDLFRFRVLYKGGPATGVRVERELLSPAPPKPSELPTEVFIAISSNTDERGMAAFTFPGSGWYGITAVRHTDRELERGGRKGKIIERATFWVYVAGSAE